MVLRMRFGFAWRITTKLMGLDVHVRCQVEGISDAVTLAQNLNQLLCLSMNDEALVRWVLKRPRTLKPCKRNYLFEGSIEERRQVKGQSVNLSKNNLCWMHLVVPYPLQKLEVRTEAFESHEN